MPDSNSSSASSAGSWQLSNDNQMTRPTKGGLVELITYDPATGRFARRFLATPGHFAPMLVELLGEAQLKEILAQLQAQVQSAPSAEDTAGLQEFIRRIETALKSRLSE